MYYGNSLLIFTVLVGLGIIFILVLIKIIVSPNEIITTTCSWCGKEIQMTRREYKWQLRHYGAVYCSGKCRREDETSRGVEEKRYRIFNE